MNLDEVETQTFYAELQNVQAGYHDSLSVVITLARYGNGAATEFVDWLCEQAKNYKDKHGNLE